MAKYNITYLSRCFFPWFWQTETNLRLVDLLQSVFDQPNDDFEVVEALYRLKVGYSIQRLSLENGLNDRFDTTLRRIQVTNGEGISPFVYNESEALPAWGDEVYIRNEVETTAEEVYIFNSGESTDAVTAFSVSAPEGLEADYKQAIRAAIEAVLILGTEYNLTFI